MKTIKGIIIAITVILSQNIFAQYHTEPQPWVKDLIICEISTKGYTSPNGPESGTFNSLKEKVPYLADLGVTGIWLTGHSWANDKHFYNIWTQYACIRPDSIDPSLGTPQEFKALIDEFHKYDIKVFLDAITHGVMDDSPLVKEYPHWFKGRSWGMTDFDWFGNHKDLDDWWVQAFSDHVTKYGIDGFRLDLWMYRPELWNRIKENAANAGHPIVVFQEAWDHNESYSNGVNHFLQGLEKLGSRETGLYLKSSFLNNPPVYYKNALTRDKMFDISRVVISYTDGATDTIIKDRPRGLLTFNDEKQGKELDDIIKVHISNIDPQKSIKKITVFPRHYSFFPYVIEGLSNNMPPPRRNAGYTSPAAISGLSSITLEIKPFIPDYLYHTTILSCHDDGWEGFARAENPYVAEGSRYLFGYSGLFTPSIVNFMAGEEFDADFVPLPGLSYFLFDKKDIGKGKWLYGSWLQWDQLKKKKHADMFADVKKMISIRKQEKDLLRAADNNSVPNILSLEYKCGTTIPVPYIMWNKDKAIFVAGNNTNKDVSLSVTIPLDAIGMNAAQNFTVTNLWTGEVTKANIADLKSFRMKIKKDRTPNGGVAIYKIEPGI